MKVYQIDYDLRNRRDYQPLYQRIESYPMWCHPLESTWVIATESSAIQVRDHLKGAMDHDDGILVTRLKGEAAWDNLNPKVGNYLKDLLERQAA
ncbi:hypothetical protein [Marinobacter sp.]|uniref:hypothetical protein n=1 Tax=Marinobacter sp. TaxID=50741 RepID=UPI002616CB77|nr:hypothetical protein [Marinobacter sp.]